MRTYLDSSALAKRYIDEPGRELVLDVLSGEGTGVTSLITGAEVPAAIARASRMGIASAQKAQTALALFWADWPGLFRLRVDEPLVKRAAELAWQHGLRGYDAVHLASCLVYAEGSQEAVRLATFDRQLAHAARELGIETLPEDLDGFLSSPGEQATT